MRDPDALDVAARQPETPAIAGKRFYTWTNLGTFGGAVGIVTLIWKVFQSLPLDWDFESNLMPFALSLGLMLAYALVTEPPGAIRHPRFSDQAQKLTQAIINGFLIYAIVIGLPVAIPG